MAHRRFAFVSVGLCAGAVALSVSATALGAEPASCLSPTPGDWPSASKPYFLLAVDTSGSMLSCTNPAPIDLNNDGDCADAGEAYCFPNSCPSTAPKNSCNLEPTRINDAKCALRNTVKTFAGEVNFGLITFPLKMSGCSAGTCADSCTNATGTCNPPVAPAAGAAGEFYSGSGCTLTPFAGASSSPSPTCGNTPDCGAGAVPPPPNLPANWRNAGNIVVPLLQDPTWGASPPATNVPQLLSWFDGKCDGSQELFALGATPLEGILRTAQEYLITGWNTGWQDGTYCNANPLPLTYATPLTTQDRPCRSVNVILVTDGDETCFGTPSNAAAALLAGVQAGGQTYQVKTHVIGFAGASKTLTDAIASAGGTQTSLSANNEAQLAQALANIISGAIKPEVCNNGDDNCNGCTDEGYSHWCNARTDCCPWTTQAQRQSCINVYLNNKDPASLPCTTAAQKTDPSTWLCYEAGEQCNGLDDDCDGQTDEGFNKCGSPLHCPINETCNNTDDNCDGIVDNNHLAVPPSSVPYSVCPNQCNPSPEICDGCDNDCDGIADDGVPSIPCGFTPPANCAGTKSCTQITVASPGACAPGGNTFGACNNTPQAEVCDSLDNDCNGVINNGVPPTPCDVPGQPGLVYKTTFAQSQCEKGQQPCNGVCSGYVGPSTEVCDGKDNDCDGQVDENLTGLGQPCGTTTGPCTTGTTACVGGSVVCTGGVQPQPEVCNGIDDDCDGSTDDGPLGDAPASTAEGCWGLPASGCTTPCTYKTFSWCPPAGGTCGDLGTLKGPPTAPCTPGKLACAGATGWTCKGGELPAPESCDSLDNDCDGLLNDGLGSPIGDPCGLNVGQCKPGTKVCDATGKISCNGATGPQPEICNGLDDNCDGNIDEGVPPGGACYPTYDTAKYPGDRTKGLCIPGVSLCPGNGPPQCIGGKGPEPEVCDGKDNDCDGKTDEIGPGPDGIDGTADPSDPTRVLGLACGVDVGQCKKGLWECLKGQFACTGSLGPQPEVCDCLDNDCDGQSDEETEADGGPAAPLCSPGKLCVKAAGGGNICSCSLPCKTGEFPCSPPTSCQDVVLSATGQPTDKQYCLDPGPCKDCEKQTYVENGVVMCAPAGTVLDGGGSVPVCECKLPHGCRSPCYGVTCSSGLACVEKGTSKGTCQPVDNCNFFGCSAGFACLDSKCVDDPCEPNPCQAGEVCKPADPTTLAGTKCVGSCASVTCGATEECVDGQCVATGCAQPCPDGQVCHPSEAGAFCWPNNCGVDGGTSCSGGLYCDPVTGTCGNDPCTAVHCPAAQICKDGECYWAPEGGTDGGTDAGNPDAGDAGPGTDGGETKDEPTGVWRLATGGGCACRAASGPSGSLGWLSALGLVLVAFARRRGAR